MPPHGRLGDDDETCSRLPARLGCVRPPTASELTLSRLWVSPWLDAAGRECEVVGLGASLALQRQLLDSLLGTRARVTAV